ncbi:NPCBM/NEW2 domain-containing protein [Sphingomonas qomolangmaensis]|uniref:Alpha-galactosidase n=1 Tax=Sphingomonas qomolangmaensis TaxID=2918765 RepID=A0ABY5LE27_9SPHN|nr:NPCBM/NEW2 domain-containing protein [Sphingomonas qomolangmaensis]UUL84152.1 NPCBM/NEW2 domain-containing protein [Sphingomonas qomolangmaensis]
MLAAAPDAPRAPVSPAPAAAADPLAPSGRWSANTDGQAAVPPMGWNSWNAFNSDIDEEKVLASARVLVDTGLSRLGYRYVNIDDGWWLKRRQTDGRLVIRSDKFPSAGKPGSTDTSFRPFTDKIHAMGLKAGIYSDIGRNSCGQIYTPDFKNQPEGSVQEREVGLYGHVDQDIGLFFREWGFDFIKVDGCGVRGLPADAERVRSGMYRALPPIIDMQSLGRTDVGAVKALYQSVGTALQRHRPGGDYVFSLCLWGSADVRAWGKDMGNSSRTSDDISPHWGRMLTNLDTAITRPLYAHPGSWNDADMLYVGTGDFDADHLTEARSHFSLWAMINSPLIIGYDLRKLTAAQRTIFGNAQIVALNQDPAGNQAVIAYQSEDVQFLVKTLADGGKAVALFNRSAEPAEVHLTAAQLKYREDAPVALTDLWSGKRSSFTGEQAFKLAPHETLVFRTSGTRRLPNGLFLSEQPGNVNPAVDGVVAPRVDPTIHQSVTHWRGTRGPGEHAQYSGWGGAQADRAVYGQVLRVAARNYDTGLGVLTGSRMEVRNNGFARFTASVGVDDSSDAATAGVRFEVYGDGKLLARSRPMRFGEAAQPLSADVKGVRIVELVARATGGDARNPAAVVWADAAMVR